MSSNNAVITNKNQSGIQSLEIGLSILDVLIDRNEPMMLKDIAHAMQMPAAKSHRYLVSLIRKGYARQLDDGRYRLGDRISALGYTGISQNNILERLTQVANEIKNTLNCGVQIAKWFSDGPIVIQLVEPDSPISIITRIGSRMPLTTSATGRLFASYQPDTIIKPLIFAEWQNSNNSLPAPKNSKTELSEQWDNFIRLRTTIRKQGYATVTGVLLMGINAISIPIISSATTNTTNDSFSAKVMPLEYAITIIGTTEQLPIKEQHQMANQILSIAQRYQMA
ncbi:IclR family transcriptional regulator [uncultured Psychrobacter sp.]|uniref:IclR family transcriptional regulator n=1 Tax=uncultured Psychrobacter sp. TaxID=259303 RepID=UPI003459BBAF